MFDAPDGGSGGANAEEDDDEADAGIEKPTVLVISPNTFLFCPRLIPCVARHRISQPNVTYQSNMKLDRPGAADITS